MLTAGCQGTQLPARTESPTRAVVPAASSESFSPAPGSASPPAAGSREPRSILDILEQGASENERDAGAPWGRETRIDQGTEPVGGVERYWGNRLTPDGGSTNTASSAAGVAPPTPIMPPVRLIDVAVTGSLHDENQQVSVQIARRVLRQHLLGYVSMCYDRGLKGTPMLRGTVTVRQLLASDGTVIKASNEGSTLPSAQVVDCVVEVMFRPTFPEPATGTSVRSTWQLSPPTGDPR